MKKSCFLLNARLLLMAVFLLASYAFSFAPLRADGNVSLSTGQVYAKLREQDQVEQYIRISNHTNEMVFFSAVKTNDPVASPQSRLASAYDTGSLWQTHRQNFQRTGFNPVESAVPPFEYKWKYQSNRALRTPVVTGRNMYIPGEDGKIHRIDSRTGIFRESIPMGQQVFSVHLADRYLAALTDEGLHIYDRISERQVLKYPSENRSDLSFVAYDTRFYFASGGSVVCIEQDTGKELWQAIGPFDRLVLGSKLLYALSTNQVLVAFDLVTGEELFRRRLEGNVLGSPLYMDGLLYYATNHQQEGEPLSQLICLDYLGNELWDYQLDVVLSAPPSCDQHSLYLATTRGDLMVFNRFSGTVEWQINLKSPMHISPSITSSHVFAGLNNGKVTAFKKQSWEQEWSIDFSFPLYAELVLAQGLIYTVDQAGNLVAYGRSWENIVPPMSPENARGYPGNSLVTLYWSVSRSQPDLAGYNIYRRTDFERNFSFLSKIPVMNQYQDDTVANGTRYHYVVRAYDLYGNESTNSSQISLNPSVAAPPIWIEFSPNNGVVMPGQEQSFLVRLRSMALPPGTYSAYIHFILYGAALSNEWLSLEVKLEVQKEDSTRPGAPQIKQVQFSDSRVVLTWDAVVGARQYLVYRSQVSLDQYQLLTTLNSSVLRFQDDTPLNGRRYFYALKAVNQTGEDSDFSTEVSVVPEPLPLTVNLIENSILFEAVININGSADPKAKLTVNQHSASVGENGFFSTFAGVPVGQSYIQVQATDTEGKIQQRTILVSYRPSLLQVQLRIDDPVVQVNQMRWPYLLEAPPIIRESRTFVPLRFLGEIIGASVSWDANERKVTYVYGPTVVELWIGRKEIRINGEPQEIDVAPFIESGRTLVPLRFITEPMGAKIQWDAERRIILLLFEF